MEKVFKISEKMVANFASITGDYNSLHMDEEFARKTKYRQRLVHGMLPFSFICLIQENFPDQKIEFLELDTSFRKPILIGDEIRLDYTYSETESGKFSYNATWYNHLTEEIVIKSKGGFTLYSFSKEIRDIEQNQTSCLLDEVLENNWTINEIANKKEELNISLNSILLKKYLDSIINEGFLSNTDSIDIPISHNLISTLLLSTLVGMKLPGKYATFAKFQFSFPDQVPLSESIKLVGEVGKVSVASESMEVATTLLKENAVLATGKLNVVVNSPPQKIISCQEIKSNYIDIGLKDKVVVITGASRGIGAATAKLFAMQGAKVIVNYYKGKKDAELIVEDIEKNGGTAIPLQCDIRDKLEVKKFIAQVVEKFCTVNVLVNNAVKEAIPKNVVKLEWQDYLSELEVSLKGMHNCCQTILPIFKQQKFGKIINISTIFVDNPVTGQSQYITAKSAVVGYTKSLAKELAKLNIQVNFVVPNMTETDLVSCVPSDFTKRIAASRDFGRNLQPIEVAQSILFLASSWANSITGQKVVLNLGDLPFG
ncbi:MULTISPECIES: SDR family oxidoreductase [Okeania]|uniref:SDR family oxidoreductase n=1 Tax=Okeania hirsuta TaxID=1458930 RepID=A0A3N6RG57_9CYAN|nr:MULTISPECIES: SDR family oxidoreductase [Okeania]NET79023.1 SDR family oxidoreductase [Okeania sp. SIO1F9]RQH12173.1 SDR family oxidoreductase [Okeania hirsuta]RQH28489.1 SDR family oxidoreductase [Okeania hirsuta]